MAHSVMTIRLRLNRLSRILQISELSFSYHRMHGAGADKRHTERQAAPDHIAGRGYLQAMRLAGLSGTVCVTMAISHETGGCQVLRLKQHLLACG